MNITYSYEYRASLLSSDHGGVQQIVPNRGINIFHPAWVLGVEVKIQGTTQKPMFKLSKGKFYHAFRHHISAIPGPILPIPFTCASQVIS